MPIKRCYCIVWLILIVSQGTSYSQQPYFYSDSFTIEKNERWYGAAVNEGHKMPFKEGYSLNLYGNNVGNQVSPFLVSSAGRFIWSEEPIEFSFHNNMLVVNSMKQIKPERGGSTLAEAYEAGSKNFPFNGKTPDLSLFESPQYNTWIELNYNQNQVDVLKYAHAIIDNGFPPGVLMIDDSWAPYYGRFEFRKDRFPDAKKMMDELHALGFKVMVWVCPFISPDTEEFRYLLKERLILFDNKGDSSITYKDAKEPLLVNWWNGYSAELDFTNAATVIWMQQQLDTLQGRYGVDGFKFDAGDMEYYPVNTLSFKKVTANEHCELWGEFGLKYPLNEYRAMWKRGGQPLAERLRDKEHTWEDLQKLIPHSITSGLLGYAFVCPDLIGGGELGSFMGKTELDEDLVVRSAQCSALMPMMQFSAAPWRVLDSVHFDAVKKAVIIRKQLTPYIRELTKKAAQTGKPIVKNMEYVFPHEGMESVTGQFMLGDKYLVAPVVEKGNSKTVIFPKGRWKRANGKMIKGPLKKQFTVPIDVLLWFERV
ncbi:MAG TPA: glycoside hydrolase family 31 protein [Flavitalea sp.]|nr:glycoside hydrolase family 31 protein [Flavitalea sp.]